MYGSSSTKPPAEAFDTMQTPQPLDAIGNIGAVAGIVLSVIAAADLSLPIMAVGVVSAGIAAFFKLAAVRQAETGLKEQSAVESKARDGT